MAWVTIGEGLLPLCGVPGSQVCEANSEASDGCLVPESSLKIDALEQCYFITQLRILLIASAGSVVRVQGLWKQIGLWCNDLALDLGVF